MRIDILGSKNWCIKVIYLIDELNRTLFSIMINKIIYNLVTRLLKFYLKKNIDFF